MRDAAEALYLALMVDNSDEAVSLAEYLNQHGIFARSDHNEVCCPIVDPGQSVDIYACYQTWTRYWEHSDRGLFGLPLYQKPAEA